MSPYETMAEEELERITDQLTTLQALAQSVHPPTVTQDQANELEGIADQLTRVARRWEVLAQRAKEATCTDQTRQP